MAGLTNDTREIAADPDHLEGLLEPAYSTGLMSLQMPTSSKAQNESSDKDAPSALRWMANDYDLSVTAQANMPDLADLRSIFRLVRLPADFR